MRSDSRAAIERGHQSISGARQFAGLAGWLGITLVAAALGSAASINAQPFYQQLAQPSWAPPPTVFGPVWTALYILMGIAAWWVWRARGYAGALTALNLYLVQLAFNASWSWVFFAWQLGTLALVNIALLWILIPATLVAFWRIRPLAGLLLAPYLAWVSFAAALNFSLVRLNPGIL
jgi:translocator protein